MTGVDMDRIFTPDDLRRRWRDHFRTCDRLIMAHRAECARVARILRSPSSPVPPPEFPPDPALPPFPEECRGLTCGARTRAGTPCKRRDLGVSGRCKLHGGMSTGPRTPEGKAKCALNGFKPGWRKRSSC